MSIEINPSESLHQIFKQLVEHGPPPNGPNAPVSGVWTRALGVSVSQVPASALETVRLAFEVEQILNQNDFRHREAHLERLNRIKTALMQVTSMSWAEFSAQFDQDFVSLLEWLASDVSDYFDETPLSTEDLQSLQTEIEDLINDVVESGLDETIKHVITVGLDAVRDAILQYRVRGVEGIQHAWDKNFSVFARYHQELQTANENDDRGVISRVWDFLMKLDATLSVASNVPQLAAPVITQLMLTGGG